MTWSEKKSGIFIFPLITCFLFSSSSLSEKGKYPANIPNKTIPLLQTSANIPWYSLPSKTSGAAYTTVPHGWSNKSSSVYLVLNPKSINFKSLFESSNILSILISRWAIFWLCK